MADLILFMAVKSRVLALATACTLAIPFIAAAAAIGATAQPAAIDALGAGVKRIEPAGSTQPPALQSAGRPGGAAIRIGSADSALEADRISALKAIASAPGNMGATGSTGSTGKTGARARRLSGRAAWSLGLIYLHGRGSTPDSAQALHWFRTARELGEPLASAGLAWCAMDGCGGPPEPAAARPLINQLRQVDAGRALYMTWLLGERLAPLQLPDRAVGPSRRTPVNNRGLLVRAAGAGNAQARIELGIEAAAAGRRDEAIAYFKAAASRSRAAASNLVFLQSQSVPTGVVPRPGLVPSGSAQPPVQPEDNTIRVPNAAQQSAGQLLAAARRYHRGDGVPANYAEALRFYQLADAKGNVEAHRMLAMIASRPSPDGSIDVGWMLQLAWVDVSGTFPLLEIPAPGNFPQREPTPLSDLLLDEWPMPEGAPSR